MTKNSFDVAKLVKEKGNEAFEAKDYVTARLLYSKAMEIDPSQYIYPLNSAIANLKLERWRDAESNATAVLEMVPDNLKALYRRGLARTELRQWSQARQDIQAFIDGGGCSAAGHAVLDTITRFEAASTLDPINDRSNDSSEASEKLSPDDVSGLAIRDSKVAGQGVFATREFKKGDTILREKPLLTIPLVRFRDQPAHVKAALRKLSPKNTARFLSLDNTHPGDCCADRLPHHASKIFDSNMIMLPGDNGDIAICFYAARFNHSCAPNTWHVFETTTGEFRMFATRPIREGEEIFREYSYASTEEMHCSPRTWRQAELQRLLHFTCACALCVLPDTAAVQASDARRVQLGQVFGNLQKEKSAIQGMSLTLLVEGMRMSRKEGILDVALVFMALAMAVCAHHSDWASAKYWAEMITDEFGEGGLEEVQDSEDFRKYLFQPELLPGAGLGPQEDFSGIRLD
ncbi:hypothetical protein HYPSUDRAFT_44944 [Hypholoma sublateritium FD-334 SS-4]|uniref:SET domain-containing protein n=1 Tax=Hypholoma sublateritium (strain FD-334 SS-4) TaxID=945553 RepID=A0A0D2PF10_HYPSF|nr:hypothetical protein HYPSUDRAFT_44944 [Hypholoma sublateritium FD-334 SS-4]